MALKDRFDKIISYFDTDDVSENEVHEVQERTSVQRDSRAATAQEASQRSHMTNSAEEEMIGSRPRTSTYNPNRQERQRVQRTMLISKLLLGFKIKTQFDNRENK